jgi:hypothetical protein
MYAKVDVAWRVVQFFYRKILSPSTSMGCNNADDKL